MYSLEALSLYDGGWRSADISELIVEYYLTFEQASDICTQLAELEREEQQ